MKKTKIVRIAWVLAALLGLYACSDSFLDAPVTGQLTNDKLTGKAGLNGLLIGSYSMIGGRWAIVGGGDNWVWGSIRGGDGNKGTDPGDYSDINPIQTYNARASQGTIQDKWNVCYEGITRANAVLSHMKGVEVSAGFTATEQAQMAAQAKFLRAYFYFELARTWGKTPYVTEDTNQDNLATTKNDQDLYPKIEADLTTAITDLPETWSEAGRVNSWAAKAMLAKVYMYEHKYTEAQTLFTDLIANGKTSNGKKYGLVPKFPDVFKASNDNNEESVFAYQAAANTGSPVNANYSLILNWPYNTGPDGPGNCCGFDQPSFELANSFRTSGGLPLLDGSYNTGANQLVTDMGKESTDAFTPDAGELDPRIDFVIGRRGIPYLDWQDFPGKAWIRNQPNGGPYAPKKYIYYKADKGTYQDNSSWTPGLLAQNIYIIRFADVLLMAAEAEIEVGSLATAQTYIDMVRTRAANSAAFVQKGGGDAANYSIATYGTAGTQAEMRDRVRFERKLELSDEGHRFYDLVRWGIAKSAIDAYLNYEKTKLPNTFAGAQFDSGVDELLPIPQAQIDLSGGVLTQNSGFGG